ncbi:hypothetical protein [uncultured Winogradskyella sp.]|uniref:hypothetical protein n=1 Tax=uncultured Winogradskyella sp. TaxID=395353 RepID=UPI0026117120|nr:hypothetical protein [uncultured Winogradskyella sp.]
MKIINVLIVENENLLVDVLANAFTSLSNKIRSFNLKTVRSYSGAVKQIEANTAIDITLLNINIPPCNSDVLVLADDVNAMLHKTNPKAKTILFSSYRNTMHMQSVLKTINPECLLIKSDIDYKELTKAIETVLVEPPYYSKSVLRCIRKRLAHNIVIDKIDKSILHYLSIGIKMKEIPRLVCLSNSSVEYRKRKLKDIFCSDKATDRDLLDEARDKGFI